MPKKTKRPQFELNVKPLLKRKEAELDLEEEEKEARLRDTIRAYLDRVFGMEPEKIIRYFDAKGLRGMKYPALCDFYAELRKKNVILFE